MKAKIVTVERLKSLPNYENERVCIEIELEKGDDPADAVEAARQFIYKHLYGKDPGPGAAIERLSP